MNTIKRLFSSIVISFLLLVVAVFSIQNIELITVKFFWLESIKMPLGVFLSMVLGFGLISGSLIISLFSNNKKPQKSKYKKFNNSSKKGKFTRDWEEENDPLFDWE